MTPRLLLRRLRETLRESLWFWPAVAILLGLAGGLYLAGVTVESGRASVFLFRGDAEAARSVLSTILGSTLTVTGVTFSVTIAVLQNASQQFSPRLLRQFMRDRPTQVSLGTLLAAFSFTLAVIARLGEGDEAPAIAMTTVLALILAAIAALVRFIHHMSEEVRVEMLMRSVLTETLAVIAANYPPWDGENTDDLTGDLPPNAVAVRATRSGYIQAIDREALAQHATAQHAVIQLRLPVGQHIAEHSPLAWAWRSDGNPPDMDTLSEKLNAAVDVGFERSMEQDPAFGLRQLVDMGIKAISPAINDPRTTVEAVANLTVILTALAGRELGPMVRTDDGGAVRVALPGRSFDDYLGLGCGQIRRYGAAEPAVTAALLELLEDVALALDRDAGRRRAAVAQQIEQVMLAAERATQDAADLADVHAAAAAARAALDGTPSPIRPPVQS